MAGTAAHLVDQVFPLRPVRQWVLSVPQRPRYSVQRNAQALGAVLLFCCGRLKCGCARGRLGAVSLWRFGASFNAHAHFHCCGINGVFATGEDGQVHFVTASTEVAGSGADLILDPAQLRTRSAWHLAGCPVSVLVRKC